MFRRSEIRSANLISIRYLGGDGAVLHLYTDGSQGESAIPDRELRRTHIHLVFAKVDAQWKITHTAIMDAKNWFSLFIAREQLTATENPSIGILCYYLQNS